MDTNNLDLETFRKQWQEEVTARLWVKEGASKDSKARPFSKRPEDATVKVALPPNEVPREEVEPIDGISTQAYHDLEDKEDARRLDVEGCGHHPSAQSLKEPKSALEHYEKAIEREDQGNLGDSLKLYRQAFRVSSYARFCRSS